MAADTNKGADLENRVARIEFSEGAFVRLRWPVSAPSSNRQITDVDVLSVDFDSRLRPFVSVIECKAVRGLSQEADRLLWLTGLKKYLGADRAVLIRDAISSDGRALGRRLQIDIFGANEVSRRELPRESMPGSFGLIGTTVGTDLYKTGLRELKTLGFPADYLSFIRDEYILASPVAIMRQVSALPGVLDSGSSIPDAGSHFVAASVTQALAIAALRSAGTLDSLGKAGLESRIEDGISPLGGESAEMTRFVRLTDAFVAEEVEKVHQAYVAKGVERISWQTLRLHDELSGLPKWLDRFYDLIERLRATPEISRQIPQTLDLLFWDLSLGANASKSPSFDHLFTPEHYQLILVIFDLLREVTPWFAPFIDTMRSIQLDRRRTE